MIWPFGAEHWCNLEGAYIHIVSDMSHLAGEDYETSICSLGVIGTRYVRTGESLPSEITLAVGESWSFSLEHIHSEIDIGTQLQIAVREASNSNLIIINERESATDISIDTEGFTSDQSFTV